MKNTKSESKELMIVPKFNWTKYLHIAIIVLGSIFILFPSFHEGLWFDESYSVGIANHSFAEIWSIGSHDVHPILYYFMLRIIGFLTNQSILAYRLFSTLPLIILAILGYTHLRKDFGGKVGFLFSFLILFMPVNLVYASEIRMYTWAMLFVFVTALYGYRIYKSGISNKNWMIFSIFSLASAYTHYYSLVAVGLINIALFIYFLVNNIKQRNYEVKYIKYSENLKKSIISAIVQILLYLPWLVVLLGQFMGVSNGFWIGAPNFLEMFEFQFTGNLGTSAHVNKIISYAFSAILAIYMIYLFCKKRKEIKAAKMALILYFGVLLTVGIVSLKTPILYARYLLTITGVFLFVLAVLMAKDNNKTRVDIICIMILIVSAILNISLVKINYDESNSKPIDFMESSIEDDDIIIVDNAAGGYGSGFVSGVNFPDNKLYFWDRLNWNVEEAYKAFGETVYTLDNLKDYKGRIWVVSDNDESLLNAVIEELGGDIEVLCYERFDTKYQGYQYAISLIERK